MSDQQQPTPAPMSRRAHKQTQSKRTRPWGLVALLASIVVVLAAATGLWTMRGAEARTEKQHARCQVLNKWDNPMRVSTTCGDFVADPQATDDTQRSVFEGLSVGGIYDLEATDGPEPAALLRYQRSR